MDAYLRTCAVSGSVQDNVWSTCRPASASGSGRVTEDKDGLGKREDGEITDGRQLILGDGIIVPKI